MTNLASKRILLEVAIASPEDARTAQAGGADRLELNAALALGGLTPSLGTLIEACSATDLPLMVMIRPRPGGFCYSEAEFQVMQRDLDLALDHGADGVVFGILHPDGRIDEPRCALLLAQCGSKKVVFHRAFDVVPDPFTALDQLVALGFHRVMTSGQETSALRGAPLIAALTTRAASRIEILPAAGIRSGNVTDLITQTACDQVHASLRTARRDSSVDARPQISFSGPAGEGEAHYHATSAEGVMQLREALDGICRRKEFRK